MDEVTSALAATIGARIKRERQERRWTLDQLAQVAGVSRRMVVNVEQGAANPSVGTLLRISDALGIGLPALVAPAEPRPLTAVLAGEGAVLWTGPRGGRGELVAGTAPPDVLELWDWHLGVGDWHVSEAHSPGTQEVVHVLAGTVRIGVEEQSVTLATGDAVAFPGDVEHSYTNAGTEPARFSLTVFEPGVGASRHADHETKES